MPLPLLSDGTKFHSDSSSSSSSLCCSSTSSEAGLERNSWVVPTRCANDTVQHNADRQNTAQDAQLLAAVEAGDVATARALLPFCDVDKFPPDTCHSLLYVAVESGSEPMVRLLLEEGGADQSIDDGMSDYTPFMLAAKDGHVGMMEALSVRRYIPPPPRREEEGDERKVEEVKRRSHIDKCRSGDRRGRWVEAMIDGCQNNKSAASLAAASGRLEALQWLHAHGAKLNETGSDDGCVPFSPPLHEAVDGGSIACVRFLLSVAGCDPNLKDGNGLTPMDILAQFKRGTGEMRLLLAAAGGTVSES